MAIVLRYVDKNGHVVERFIDIEHVTGTAAISLKETIDEVFSRHKLSMSRLRGQGYNGASNMQGEFNGLKALIMKESGCAYYIRCFAHQLQLALVAMAKKNIQIESLFTIVTILVNVVGASSKLYDPLREKQSITVIEALNSADSFSAFDSQKLLRLAQFYPKDFSMNELAILKIQLETYIVDMRSSIEFLVATATIEKAFSAMKILKNRLRNRMGDQ
ncbi:hypothetical protein COP2_007703 [Malus domestica]